METTENVFDDVFRDFVPIGVRSQVAGLDHVHPGFTLGDQSVLEGLSRCTPGADDADEALRLEIILQDVPGEFVGVFKTLDEALLLQFGKRTLAGKLDRFREAGQRLPGNSESAGSSGCLDFSWFGCCDCDIGVMTNGYRARGMQRSHVGFIMGKWMCFKTMARGLCVRGSIVRLSSHRS